METAIGRGGAFLWQQCASVAHNFNAIAKAKPVVTGLAVTVAKTSAADMVAQKVVEQKSEIDWKRHAMFASFGLVYLGGFQYWLYNRLFTQICAPITATFGHKGVAPIKTFLDQGIHHPFVYFPSFYALKGVIEQEPLQTSMRKYREHLYEDCKSLWSIWIPAQMVNFAFVPRHLRIPFVAGTSMLWTVVLSVKRGALDSSAVQEMEVEEF